MLTSPVYSEICRLFVLFAYVFFLNSYIPSLKDMSLKDFADVIILLILLSYNFAVALEQVN